MRTRIVVDLVSDDSSSDSEVEILEAVATATTKNAVSRSNTSVDEDVDDDDVQVVEPPRRPFVPSRPSPPAAASATTAMGSSTMPSPSLLKNLSIAELKRRLTARGISFQGCIEKSDLVERLMFHKGAEALKKEPQLGSNHSNQTSSSSSSSNSGSRDDGDPYGPLKDGETTPFTKYKIKRTGMTYYCSCPAWRFQKTSPALGRTCKHINQLRAGFPPNHIRTGGTTQQQQSPASSSKAKKPSSTNNNKKRPAATTSSSNQSNAKKPKGDMIQVTLAEKWNPTKQDPTGYYLSEKLDGMRCVWDGHKLWSRNGNEIPAPLFFVRALPTDICLDGELFLGRQQFQKLMSIKSNPNDPGWSKVSLVVFDAPRVMVSRGSNNNSASNFGRRLEAVRQALARVQCPRRIAHVLEQTVCTGPEHVQTKLDSVLARGGEGVMLRNPAAPYEAGRSQNLLKVKRVHDAEAKVVGYEEGKGRHQGRLGALQCAMIPSGERFKIGTGFTDAQREDRPPIGAIVTYQYQELTNAGLPRFPVFVRVRAPE